MSARAAETVPRKAGKIPRWARWFGGVLLVVIALPTIAYLGRGRLIAPFALARVAAILHSATGLDLRVGSVGGNWWSNLELGDVELSGSAPTTELTSLRIARATVRFDLRELLRGNLDAISSIELDSVAVAVEVIPKTPRKQPPRPWDASTVPFPWPAKLPAIDARNVEVHVGLGEGRSIDATGLSALHAPAGDAGQFLWKVHADQGRFSDPWYIGLAGALDADLIYRAGVLEVPRIELDGKALARACAVDLRRIQRLEVSFEGILERFSGELEFRGATDADDLRIWVSSHAVELGEVLRELRVSTTISGRAEFSGVFNAPLATLDDWTAQAWGRIDRPEFLGRTFDQITFAGSVDRDQLELREATLLRGANALSVLNFSVPFTGSDLGEILRSLRGSADLEVFDPKAMLVDASPEVLRAAGRVRSAHLSLVFGPSGFTVRNGEVATDVGGLMVQHGAAGWGPGNVAWYEGTLLDLEAALSFDDLAPLAALFGQGDVKGALAGTVALSGPLVGPSGNFRLTGDGLSLRGFDLGHVAIEARADNKHLELARLELDGALGQATASGDFDYASGVISNSRLRTHTFALDKWSGNRASAGFAMVDATITGSWRDPDIWASAQAWDVEVEGRSIERVDVEGLYSRGCLRIDRLVGRVAGVAVDAAGSVCRAHGTEPLRVSLDRARLARDFLDLSLEAPLEVAVAADAVSVRGLCVGGSAGHAIADISWTPTEQEVSIDASELVPMQLLGPFLPAGVVIEGMQGSVHFKHSPEIVFANFGMRVDQLQLFEGSPRATLAFDAQLLQKEFQVRQLVMSAPGHFGVSLSGRIPTDPLAGEWLTDGPFELAGEANVSDFESLPRAALGLSSDWRGDGSATFRLTGTSSAVRGEITSEVHVTGYPADSIWSRGQSGAFQWKGTAVLGEAITLEKARLWLPDRASADIDGRVDLSIDLVSWLAGRVPDWNALPVSLEMKLLAQDLSFVNPMFASLRRTGGELHGDLHLTGTLAKPLLVGSVDLTRGEVRLSNALAPFEEMAAHIEFDGTDVRIVSLAGQYGAAPFRADGRIGFGGSEPTLELHVIGEGVLVARDEGLRLRADADLRVTGPLNSLELSGDVIVVDGRFSKEFALISLPGSRTGRRTRQLELPYLKQSPWANIEFDVRITARKPIRVDTNVLRGTIEPRLVLRGNGASPRLGGTMVIGATHMKLPATTLEVTSGVLTFRGEQNLVPDLDITAVARVRGYDITAQVTGTSEDPELLFTSSPPLASEELAVLVLTGQLPESALGGPGSEAAVETVAVYLGRDLLTRWLGIEGDSEDPIAERLEFYRGAEVSQTGIESTEFIFRLTPNPKGKSRILYLRAEKDIYERFNYGVKLLFRFQ